MFTDPQIYNPTDLKKRGFISFYFEGERHRFYNGKPLCISCFPNTCKTYSERERLLKELHKEFYRALLKGWSPKAEVLKPAPKPELVLPTLKELFEKVIRDLAGGSFSKTYQRDLTSVTNKFIEFLVNEGKGEALPDQVDTSLVERFLQQFSSSGTYYQNKRRELTAVFSKLHKQGYCKANPVLDTSKRKAKAVLHDSYTPKQIGGVLAYLKDHYPNLYLCALLMYGTALRPHEEIRLLKRSHFNADMTRFTLEGSENKGGRIRSLPVPEYVREELLRRCIHHLQPEDNIFTGTEKPFNSYYLSTKWWRASKKMQALGLINKNQTLYSFRHSAAIDVFTRSQNLKLVQQLFDHSNINTSLTYLRTIGVITIEKSDMPELRL